MVFDIYGEGFEHCHVLAPQNRDPYALPNHINTVNNILNDFRREQLNFPPPFFASLQLDLRQTLDILDDLQQHLERLVGDAPPPMGKEWVNLERGGRKLVLDMELLEVLSSEGMTDHEIGHYLGCGRHTVSRRRKEAGVMKRKWTTISEDDLTAFIARVYHLGSGREGEKGIQTGLELLGVVVPRWTVRLQLSRHFNRGVHVLRRQPVARRTYRVPWINSLWHIDGHHKLIPWKIVIHGCIDGKSRSITFLRASDNNRASTVVESFREAVQIHGWPNRVRADMGKENWDVKKLMEEVRGHNRGSFIQGPSVRNQRIERLWVDLQEWCTAKYRELFIWLEKQHLLEVDNPYELWALHFCFLPQLNAALSFFVNRWNKHGLRTANNDSPRLLWLRNQLDAARLGVDPLRTPTALLQHADDDDAELEEHRRLNFEDYGVDDYGARASHQPLDSDPYVEVDPILDQMEPTVEGLLKSEGLLRHLDSIAGPAWPPAADNGVGRYVAVARALKDILQREFPDLAL
ncbi:hypothetical protein P7C73_g2440, partial [Tremellales sp. Uapishka_1]